MTSGVSITWTPCSVADSTTLINNTQQRSYPLWRCESYLCLRYIHYLIFECLYDKTISGKRISVSTTAPGVISLDDLRLNSRCYGFGRTTVLFKHNIETTKLRPASGSDIVCTVLISHIKISNVYSKAENSF